MRIKVPSKPWMNFIWRNFIPPKHSFILWLCMRDRLHTLDKWMCNIENRKCVFCKQNLKTVEHLYFKCTFVKAIWTKFRNWLGIMKEMSTLKSTIKWIKKDHKGALITSKVVTLAFASTVYHVWKARNEAIFSHKQADVSTLFTLIQSNLYRVLYFLYPYDYISL